MRKSSGFTLVELIIVVVIVAVVAAITIPNFRPLIQDNRLTADANNVVEGLNLALVEALRCTCQVTMCKSNDGLTCVNDSSGNGWEAGWIVFRDNGVLGEFDATDGDTLIRAFELNSSELTLRVGGTIEDYISYNARGQPRSRHGGLLAVSDTFRLCDDRGSAKARAIVLNNVGRIKIKTETASCP
ncbi:MAG: GspH/FimT family pseudopilin [Candidatus Competibacterales bacterium]